MVFIFNLSLKYGISMVYGTTLRGAVDLRVIIINIINKEILASIISDNELFPANIRGRKYQEAIK